jgi:hypothetical protein
MQYAQLKRTVKGRLARFSASTSLDTWINLELNNAITELEEEGFLPWFLAKRVENLALAEDANTVTLPTDFLAEELSDADDLTPKFMARLDTGENRWVRMNRLEKDPVNEGEARTVATDQTAPANYFLDELNDVIKFKEWADGAYTLSLDYVAGSDQYTADPADTEEPLWAKYAPGYLIAMVGVRFAAMYIKNKGASSIFLADLQRERTKLIRKHTIKMEAAVAVNSEN